LAARRGAVEVTIANRDAPERKSTTPYAAAPELIDRTFLTQAFVAFVIWMRVLPTFE